MANQFDGNAFDSSSLSQVPKVRSFEFDDKAIGNIRSSVNKFRGSVSLPMDFLSLLGREGLDVKLSAIYSSNIRRELTTWNLDAPTGILGLGWQLPIEMIALDPQGSGAPATNRYYLISNGSANPMVRTGVAPDGKWTFQLRNFEFWSVLYDPANQIWTIVKENGFVYTYGGGHGTSGAAQWGVRWGNWIGSSSQRAAQIRYPIAWNLSSIVSPMGHGIYYEYRNVNQKVMANGLEYTQASYIGKVTDSFGRTLTFNYGNKYGALNPGTFNGRPIIEYQARHTQLPALNAYQDRYETLFLDSVDVANASGTPVYGIKFTYSFVNQASSGDPSYPLLTKRCLRSVFQYAPNGDTLPPIRFDYVDQSSDINPCALNRVIYPSGGRASFVYKQNYIAQARKVTIVNPLPGSVPRVWFGSDYAVFTWQGTSGMRVIVQAWAGQWVTQDVTGPMGGKAAATDSLLVLTGENFFAVTFRDSSSKNDEIYFFRNDDRGTELRFGTWILSNGQGIVLALNNPSAGPSTFVSGQDFVICRNKDYTAGGFQGFSYSWQSGRWNSTLTRDADAPPLPPANTAATTALTADQNYYVASAFDAQSRSIRSNHFYRDADGAWQSSTSNSWALSGVDVVTSGGNLLLALSPMPTGVVMTYVTGTSVNTINYNLRVFQWNESYHVINVGSPGRIDLTSPVTGGKSLYNIFQTLISGGLVNNNQGLLRDIGGDQSIAGAWATRLFSAPPAGASVAVAAGDDVALLSVTGATRSNQLVTFNPNNNIWSTPPIVQTESFPSISDDYLTTGRFIYRRGTDGSWAQTPVQLANFNFPESLRNFGPRYIVYQDSNSTAAATRIVALRNGAVINLSPLTAEKFYVGEAKAGTVLSGPRFLATYPAASASFDVAPSLNLYDLSDVSLDAYVADTPVAYIEIDDAHDPSQNYYASFFYANSSESQIVYNAATGVSQYPMVMVVPGVAANSAAPPSVQPQGRSEFNYSNGLARQSSLYPAGGVQNYQNILNGIELASRIYDSTNKLVAFQLNYWTVYSRDSRGRNLYGGYARCERTTTSRDGIAQEASAAYDRGTGVLLWQEKSYTDAAGAAKRVREETLYAYQVPEYAQAFTDQHDFLSAAMGTRSVSTAGQPARAYVQSQVTTYRDWSNQSAVTIGGAARGTARLAAYEVYDWTAPGQTAPVFSFGAGARTGWLLRTRILSRCMPGGLITEQTDGTGLVSSFVYDTAQKFMIAQFPGGSVSGDEVSYYGFEGYEQAPGWVIGERGTITPNVGTPVIDAHTGTNSLSIAASTSGGAGIARTFRPAGKTRRYVFSAWMKKPAGFDNAAGNACWKITPAGGSTLTLAMPDTIGKWVYVSQLIVQPGGGATSIEIHCENANTASLVLVDDLRFSPLETPFQAYAYEAKFDLPEALLGANGETSRAVYDSFQQRIGTTNPADAASQIQRRYFSVLGNQGSYAIADPNHDLTVSAARGGVLTRFTQGEAWRAAWRDPANVWETENGVLTQHSVHMPGQLTCADPALGQDYALDVEFTLREAVTAPLGIQIGDTARIQWDPQTTRWQLLDGGGNDLLPPVDVRTFSVAAAPYVADLNAGVVSAGLQSAFTAAGYLLPSGTTVTPGAAVPNGWSLTSPDNAYRYVLRQAGADILVYAMKHDWTLIAGTNALVFWAGGKLVFSRASAPVIAGTPTLFFGNRVSVSAITTAVGPQASAQFDDSRGLTLQTQEYAATAMVVAGAVADSMGRLAVRTKPAFVTPAQNPRFTFASGFAVMDWAAGTASGLAAAAYPDDQGYPFSRQVYEASPLGRVIEEGVPGALFRVGAHSTKYAYDTVSEDGGKTVYARKITTDPNGATVADVTTWLEQTIRRISVNGAVTLRNETDYDNAGNATELRSPNYFSPPAGSTAADWVTRQTFDFGNRLATLSAGKQGTLRFVYDKAGNIRFTQDAQGAAAGTYNYTKYDTLSRQIEAGYVSGVWDDVQLQARADSDPAWPPTPPTWRKQYIYDGDGIAPNMIGRIMSIAANNGTAGTADVTEAFGYNILGNTISDRLTVSAYASGAEQRVDYEYDNAANITRIVYPTDASGVRLSIHYQIDARNQITAISEQADFSNPIATFSFGASGNPVQSTFASGVQQSCAFNSPFWLTSLRNQTASGAPLFSETLTYTDNGYANAAYYDGTIASCAVTPGAGGASQFKYSYDPVGQVLNAEDAAHPDRNLGVTAPVTHDANGNFLQVASGGRPLNFSYFPGSQQVDKVADSSGDATVAAYRYDANGNAINATMAATARDPARDLTLTYDPALMMVRTVTDAAPGGASVILTYGCRSERVLKQVTSGAAPGVRLYIRGTSTMPLMERSTIGGAVDTCYIFGPGGLVAMRRDARIYILAKDHLGSVRAVIDPAGTVVAAYDYLTYGGLAAAREPVPGFMSYLYTGQEYDPEIGLYNYRTRFYSAELGRFLAIDLGRQFFSPYLYASNNPVLYIDPTGGFSIGGFFSAIAGIFIGLVEIAVGVLIDAVAGVLEVVTGGLGTGATVALAALSGTFYGAGVSAITYSVFNTEDFSWKQYGMETLIGALGGAISGGLASGFTAGAAKAGEAVGEAIAARAGQQAATFGEKAVNFGLKATKWATDQITSKEITAGAVGYIKGVATGVAKSEAIGITKNTVTNLATGNDWDKGLDQVVFSAALGGSIGGLQVKIRTTNLVVTQTREALFAPVAANPRLVVL